MSPVERLIRPEEERRPVEARPARLGDVRKLARIVRIHRGIEHRRRLRRTVRRRVRPLPVSGLAVGRSLSRRRLFKIRRCRRLLRRLGRLVCLRTGRSVLLRRIHTCTAARAISRTGLEPAAANGTIHTDSSFGSAPQCADTSKFVICTQYTRFSFSAQVYCDSGGFERTTGGVRGGVGFGNFQKKGEIRRKRPFFRFDKFMTV